MPGYKLYLQGGGKIHEGLKCSFCLLVLKDPIQTSETGQRYCKECFKDHASRCVALNDAITDMIDVWCGIFDHEQCSNKESL